MSFLAPLGCLRLAGLSYPSRKACQLVKLLVLVFVGLNTALLNAATQSTTTTLSISSHSVAVGMPVELTALVRSKGAPVIHGEIEFCYASAITCEDLALIGTAELTASGTASIKLMVPAGRHDIYAHFVGTTTYSSSSSLPNVETIDVYGRLPSTADISVSGSSGKYTLSSNVGGFGQVPPAGRVSFLDAASNKAIANAHLNDTDVTFGQTSAIISKSNVIPQSNLLYFSAIYVMGDFDGDGVPDIAAAYPPFTSDTAGDPVTDPYNPVIIFKGDARHPGQFIQEATFVADSSSNPHGFVTAMAAADFNGDGVLDLAICFSYSGSGNPSGGATSSVGILLGDAAHPGHFLPIQQYSEPYAALSNLVVADFNKDGLPDLAYMAAGYLAVRFNSSSHPGQFPTATPYPLGGVLPDSFVVGDFNGDGLPDIAMSITTQGSGHVGLALGNPASPGELLPYVLYPVNGFIKTMVVGDFNRDGVPDIIGMHQEYGQNFQLFALYGNKSQPGTFLSEVLLYAYPPDTYDPFLASGDFNGDGVLDIAVPDSNYSSNTLGFDVFFGDSEQPGRFTRKSFPYTYDFGQFLVSDLNGDGLSDLVTALTGNSDLAAAQLSKEVVSATAVNVVPPPTTKSVYASYSGDYDHYGYQSCAISLNGQPAAPVISGITISNITATSATISWTTNVATNGGVNYGTTTNFGSQTPWVPSVSTNHSFVLSNLTPGTTYDYQTWAASFFSGCTHWTTYSTTTSFTTKAQ